MGFYVSSRDTNDRLGRIPMRQLVYRVQPLPTSLVPLVWDFGQLGSAVESVYIRQMISRAINDRLFDIAGSDGASLHDDRRAIRPLGNLNNTHEFEMMCALLETSQAFMRARHDECSYVSMRDLERSIKVTAWFLSIQHLVFDRMDAKRLPTDDHHSYSNTDSDDDGRPLLSEHKLARAFLLALSVCYHASLSTDESRLEYRQRIAHTLVDHMKRAMSASSATASATGVEPLLMARRVQRLDAFVKHDGYWHEINKCQHVFMDEIEAGTNSNSNSTSSSSITKNIANNRALLENVFMMIVCIELRIPLFVVGKPGSSKSLAKSIVARAMCGRNSQSALFRELKAAYFVNFQCSPLTTSDMILRAFDEAFRFQENVDLVSHNKKK